MSNKEEKKTKKKQKNKKEKRKKEEKRKTQNDDFGSDFTVDETTFLRAEILNLQKQIAIMVAKTQHLMPTQTSSNEALQEPLQEPRESNSTHCQTLSPKRVLKEVPKEKNLQQNQNPARWARAGRWNGRGTRGARGRGTRHRGAGRGYHGNVYINYY